MLVLVAESEIAPTATSIVTDSSLSAGVKVYVQTVSELEPVPDPTEPPASDRVGAAYRASDAVTITEYVDAVPYEPLVTPVTAIDDTDGWVLSMVTLELSSTLVSAVPALPASSEKAIEKVTAPSASLS